MTRFTRLREPVFVSSAFTWVFTVVVATTNLRAISSLESPWQTRSKISCSRGVNWVSASVGSEPSPCVEEALADCSKWVVRGETCRNTIGVTFGSMTPSPRWIRMMAESNSRGSESLSKKPAAPASKAPSTRDSSRKVVSTRTVSYTHLTLPTSDLV